MTDATGRQSPDSFSALYVDVVWNLAVSNRIMRLKLPNFATAASDPGLVGLVGEVLALATRHREALEAIVTHVDRPAPTHAVELETLLGTAAQQTAGWPPGRARDLAYAVVIRRALHLGIPSYELARNLAVEVGYTMQEQALRRFRDDVLDVDDQLQRLMQGLVTGHRDARTDATPAITSDVRDAPPRADRAKALDAPPDGRDALEA